MSRAWLFFLFTLSFALNLGLLRSMGVFPWWVASALFVGVIAGMVVWDAKRPNSD